MKYKLLRFSLLSILAMLCGVVHADYEKVTSTNDLTSGEYLIVYEAGNVAFNGALDVLDAVSNTVAVDIADGKIASSTDIDAATFTIDVENGTVKSASGKYIGVSSNSNGLKTSDDATTYSNTFAIDDEGNAVIAATFDGSTMSLRFNATSNQMRFRYHKSGQQAIQLYKKVEGSTPADTRIVTAISVGSDQTGQEGTTMNLPAAVVTVADGTAVEGATVVWSSSNEEVAAIDGTVLNLLKAGTATITATYEGDNTYKPCHDSFVMTVTATPIAGTITTLKALQEAVTSTSTPVTIEFNNVVVTAVKGSNAYLADNDGYGILVYQKEHGLEAGQVLNGTISANLVLYRGQTQITNFSTNGLTITTTEPTPTVKSIADITAANQSTLVTLKNVTFSNGKLSDGTNEITYYDNFSAGTLEDGATYDITGVVIVYNTTIEIAPRTADDIVKTSSDPVDTRLDVALSFPQERYEAIMGQDFAEPQLTINPAEYDGMISYSSSDAKVATVSYEGEVTLVGPGTVIITAEALASQVYKEAQASYTLIVKEAPQWAWADIKADLTDQALLNDVEKAGIADETNKNPTMNIGIVVDAEGNISRVANDAANANAVLNGKWHSKEHGWSNFSATVKVEGPVKITFGTCAWGGDVTVKDAAGNTAATFNTNTGACYHNDKEANVVSAYYKGEATTLTISGGSYVPYFAVVKVDPADIPSDCKIVFDVANSGAEGVAPADETIAYGKEFTLPKNFSLYKEGMTLTAWTDGTANYALGEAITVPEADQLTLTPVFTENEVSLSDRTEPVTLKWNFRRDAGAPTVAYQNQTGIWVAQAVIGDKAIDVKADFDTNNGGKFANGNWNDWAQLNGGTKWTIPSCKGATVSMEAYSDITTTTIDGQSDYTQGKTISYEIAGAAETVDVVIGDGSYYRYIQVVLPVVQSQGGGESYDNATATITWPFNAADNLAGTANPESAFSTVATNTGDLEITGAAKRTADNNAEGITFVKFKPSGSTKAVEWVVKPAAGLTFTPTKVSMWIQRFGTDAENGVTITAKAGEGDAVSLGNFTAPRANQDTSKDKYAKNSNYTNQVVIELTADQQAALASGEELVLSATVGVGSSKEGGFSNVVIEGLVNGTKADVAMYTLTTAAAPQEAGSITVYPAADQYEEGSEVTLTATENFGYDFVNWTNAAGEVVSEEAKFKHTMTADETLTANFKQVETYELALTVDGTNDYMVAIDPAPTVIDGKNMYEAGTAVQLTANQYEGLVTFTNWSDGETNSSKLISMTEDTQLTAFYAETDIIAGWDFYTTGGNGRKADFYAQDNDGDALNLVNTETGETQGWLDKSWLGAGGYESFKGAAVNWRTGEKNGDVGNWHWQTKVNAEAFSDINVQFQMLYNYNAYKRYNAEYSLDGQQWTKFGSITMEGAKAAASFKEQLPTDANNQAELYIRMIADKTSDVDGSASANDGNTLAMFFITGTPKLVDDGVAPVLVSTVPANGATGASASGKIVLTFDERVKLAGSHMPTATLANQTLTPAVSGKTVTFEYKGLEYSTEYTFTLPGGSIADLTNNFITEDITLSFTTMVRPSVTKGLYDYVVEDVDGLMAAINAAAARSDQNTRYRIFVKNGQYTIPVQENKLVAKAEGYEVPECITFLNASNVSFIGESRDGVIITNGIDKSATFEGQYGTTSKYDGIGNSDVFQIGSRVSGLYWQDLTVETGMDDATGRDLAIQDRGTKNIYKNVALRGYQDTWTSNNDNGLYYFEGGYVRGRTDYMCGKGDIYWNGVELRQLKGGYAAVPSKPAKYGWIYKDCVINGEGSGVDGNYTLGRPWGSGTPIALFINTKMNVVPSAIGWNEMSNGWPARFAEFNSTTSSGSVIDLSGRKKTFGDGHENNPVLTAEEALENSDMHRMFGDWDPTLATEQAPVPANVTLEGTTLTWDNSNYALLWAIVKNGKVIGFTTEPTYTVDDATAKYAVRAANEMGGLSEAAEATITTGIENVETAQPATDDKVYTVQGIRVDKARRGLYIVNGRKVVIK